jgi:hypothetical protein
MSAGRAVPSAMDRRRGERTLQTPLAAAEVAPKRRLEWCVICRISSESLLPIYYLARNGTKPMLGYFSNRPRARERPIQHLYSVGHRIGNDEIQEK